MHTINVVEINTTASLKQAIKDSRDAGQKTRLRAIIQLKQGATRASIAQEFVVDRSTIRYWIEQYNSDGVSALIFAKGGRPQGNPKWNTDIFTQLAKAIDQGGYWSIPRMQQWIKEHHKEDIPEQTVWYRMDQLNYSYKSARPHPAKGDKAQQATFKKGVSPRSWQKD
jgi:transposase